MIEAIFAGFKLFGWGTRLAIIGAILLALTTACGVIYYKIWDRGYEYALKAVAKQDKKAIEKATTYRGAVLDCDTRGLPWDESTGKCVGG